MTNPQRKFQLSRHYNLCLNVLSLSLLVSIGITVTINTKATNQHPTPVIQPPLAHLHQSTPRPTPHPRTHWLPDSILPYSQASWLLSVMDSTIFLASSASISGLLLPSPAAPSHFSASFFSSPLFCCKGKWYIERNRIIAMAWCKTAVTPGH